MGWRKRKNQQQASYPSRALPVSAFEKALLFYRAPFGCGFLGVNHHAFERIDRPHHLHVFRFDDAGRFGWLDFVVIAQDGDGTVLVGGERDEDVWLDAVALNDDFARRIIFRGRET